MFKEDLADSTPEEISEKSSALYKAGWEPLNDMLETEKTSKCVASFEETAHSGYKVLDVIDYLIRFNKPPQRYDGSFKPTPNDLSKEWKALLEKLQSITDSQKIAFRYPMFSFPYWGQSIALAKEFKFLKVRSNHVGHNTKGVLVFDLLLPFNNQNHDDSNCVAAKDLPIFYKYKGDP